MPENFRPDWPHYPRSIMTGIGLSMITNTLFNLSASRQQRADYYDMAILGMVMISLSASVYQHRANHRLSAHCLQFASAGIVLGYKLSGLLRSTDSIANQVEMPPLVT